MSTQTKPKIDPAVEDGAVLLAEQILPANEGRLERALALEEAWRPFAATEARIEAAIKRVDEIAEELPNCSDETTRKKLLAERTELTGQLVHAGADIEATAEPYAEALGHWAIDADQSARGALRRLVTEERPLRNAQAKIRQKLDPSLSKVEAASEAEQATLSKEFATHREQIEALGLKKEKVEELAMVIGQRVRKFGERGYDGSLFDRGGQREWLQRTRVRVSRLTTDRTGMTDMLKPMGRGLMATSDTETRATELAELRLEVAETKGLPKGAARRLRGETRAELEADADQLAPHFERPAESVKPVSMNSKIRRLAGREPAPRAEAVEPPPVPDFDGGARESTKPPFDMNGAIREAAGR